MKSRLVVSSKQRSEEGKIKKDDNQKNEEVNVSGINDKNLIENKVKKIDQEVKINNLDNKKENTDRDNIIITNDINVENNAKNPIKIEEIGSKNSNNNPQENQKENDIGNDIPKEKIGPKDSKNFDVNKQDNIKGIKNDIKRQPSISTDEERLKTKIKEENNLIPQTSLITEINNQKEEISLTNSQNNQTIKIKINCLPNCSIKDERTEYMSILYDLDTNIINEIDMAMSSLRFPQNFDFLSPLNQILNKYGKQKETQTTRYYMDCFFDSDIFKTHMQEEKFESMFNFSNQHVFDENNIKDFRSQWKKTMLLHFYSQQFENQKLKAKQDFCFEVKYQPSVAHNILPELVNQICSSVKNFNYTQPEDFFR